MISESGYTETLKTIPKQNLIQSYLLGNTSQEELRTTTWKHTGSESVAYVKKLGKSLEALAYYMNYYNLRKNAKSEEDADNAD